MRYSGNAADYSAVIARVILLYDTTKKDCCTDVQQSFLMRFQQKLLIIQQRLHQWGKHLRKHRSQHKQKHRQRPCPRG